MPSGTELSYQLCGKKGGPGTIVAQVVPSQRPSNIGLVDANRASATLEVR